MEYLRWLARRKGYDPNYKPAPSKVMTTGFVRVHLDIRISSPEFLSLPPGYLADDIAHVLSKFKNPFGKLVTSKIEDNFQGTDDMLFLEDITCCQWLITKIQKVMDKHGEPSYYQVSLTSPILITDHTPNTVSDMCRNLKSAYQFSDDQEEMPNLRAEVGFARDHREGRSTPLDFKTVKNLTAFLFTFERILNTIHAPHVIKSREVLPLTGNCEASWYASQKQLTNKEFLEVIRRCRSSEELLAVTSHPNSRVQQAYSVRQALGISNSTYPMVQFNQHEATLDADRINNWVMLCFALVRSSLYADIDEMFDFLQGEEEIPSNLNDLIQLCGMPKAAKFYEDKVYDHTDEFYQEVPFWNRVVGKEDTSG
ncbi:hypothetical protein HYALB_00007057 [Hymenoscyphus albidus]|uniref:Uncharacterized protein n=1 Tax=Hymenoscyphus albidus TaxID=595503 RepID=A0A9N9PUV7_9HELO|nr:hypothetical protein HYALB_00007057 [Hymenoscyphus albidus]